MENDIEIQPVALKWTWKDEVFSFITRPFRKRPKSNLVIHAETELKLAGLYDKDSHYEGMLAEAVIELIKVFSKQGHSGYSAQITRWLFNKLANFENLMPVKLEDFVQCDLDNKVWQCKRNSDLFLNDDKTGYYSVDDKERKVKYFKDL